MVQSDALSRQPDFCPDDDHDNENIVMLPDNMFVNLIDTNLQEKIVLSTDLDQSAVDALNILLKKTLKTLAHMTAGLRDWTVQNCAGQTFLFYKGKHYIPHNTDLRRELVQHFHDHKTAGHPGELGTYNNVREHYWWPWTTDLCQELCPRMRHLSTIQN